MTFIIQGLDSHEFMSVEQLFKRLTAEKVQAIVRERPIKGKDPAIDGKHSEYHPSSHTPAQAYQVVDQLPKSETVLFVERIMTSPVVVIPLQATLSDVLAVFQTKPFRHLPIVADGNRLAGIISDRDIMRYLGGFTRDYHQQTPHKTDETIEQLMQPRVLAASANTDVRYVARLFVEQHVCAMPIVVANKLVGIVTRSDILRAVMRHFVLELWA